MMTILGVLGLIVVITANISMLANTSHRLNPRLLAMGLMMIPTLYIILSLLKN